MARQSRPAGRAARARAESAARGAERIALLLQGGGALGAYQAGLYAGLAEAGLRPHWIAGISIGAVNGAIVAGNPPERAVERLDAFWKRVSASVTPFPMVEEWIETAFNQTAAATTLMFGAPGFFRPRLSPPYTRPCSAPEDLSYYETSDLRRTLEELVDFDRINDRNCDGRVRLSVGAVGVSKGNFAYFDSDHQRIGPEHIMASGALPPGLPPVFASLKDRHGHEEAGWFWDGGLVSNTPLQYVIDEDGPDDILAFQVDLFPARGPFPKNLFDVEERQKDIRYSSRTRHNTDVQRRQKHLAAAARRLAAKLPAAFGDDPDLRELLATAPSPTAMTLVHFIYKRKHTDSFAKDYEFSRATIEAHWRAGFEDASKGLASDDWRDRERPPAGELVTLDLAPAPADTGEEPGAHGGRQ